MKHELLVLSTMWLSLSGMTINDLYNKQQPPRNEKIGDAIATGAPFQITLIPNKNGLGLPAQYGLITGIPAIGVYGSPYLFRKRIAIIQLAPLMLTYGIPQQLRKSLESQFGQSLETLLSTKTIYAQIIIQGPLITDVVKDSLQDNSFGQRHNMVFHPFGYAYSNQYYFNYNIPVGIFTPDGVQGVDMPTNALAPLSVNAHNGGGMHLSPNNAKIQLGNKTISTFWSAAVAHNKSSATITYHILINTASVTTQLTNYLNTASNLGDLLTYLQLISNDLSTGDQHTLNNAISLIQTMIEQSVQQSSFDVLKNELKQLQQQLVSLTQALNALT